jgi:ribosome biogenesis GTPase / thiamine phosphate phosphatase
MSKRRINKQQTTRIQKTQNKYHEARELNHESLADGLVLTRFSRHAEIEYADGMRIKCSIRPNLDTLVAGDRVIWQPEGEKQGVVVSLYPRGSLLARPTQAGLKKPVAANITQLVIVVAPKPELSWPLLDSYLIIAESLKLHATIVMNKADLVCDDIIHSLNTIYKPLGYPIIFTNRNSKTSYDQLKEALNHQVSVFIGQSGVGKSSLISEILPDEDIAIAQISEQSELGKHTTSNSRYYHLPQGGALIDSPGVREFSLWHIEKNLMAQGYKEFRPFISQCKFRNCTHINTPHCAVLEAISEGIISQKRYDNFIKLVSQYI